MTVGDVPVRALRVTYVGELGWELYCPAEYGMTLWRTLWEAGEPHGIVAGGYRAIDSLRVEKGYRVWGADITPDETPYEAGLGFAVKKDKDFIGRDALLGGDQPRKRLCCIVLEDPRSVALGNEPVRDRRRDRRPGHERRLRLHGRALDRVRVPAAGARRARHRGGARHLRQLGRGRGGRGAAVRPGGRAGTRLRVSRPYDEAYEEDGEPTPALRASCWRRSSDPGALAGRGEAAAGVRAA